MKFNNLMNQKKYTISNLMNQKKYTISARGSTVGVGVWAVIWAISADGGEGGRGGEGEP